VVLFPAVPACTPSAADLLDSDSEALPSPLAWAAWPCRDGCGPDVAETRPPRTRARSKMPPGPWPLSGKPFKMSIWPVTRAGDGQGRLASAAAESLCWRASLSLSLSLPSSLFPFQLEACLSPQQASIWGLRVSCCLAHWQSRPSTVTPAAKIKRSCRVAPRAPVLWALSPPT
jgi:hypothetical protein